MKEITIILTNRNTLEFLKLAVESIRKNQSANHELIIMDDNSSDGSKEWLHENRMKHGFSFHTHGDNERHGIVGMVDEGVSKATKDVVFVGHSDMYYAKSWDENLLKHLQPKTIVCSTRIEPPLHPQEKCKITQPFGNFVQEFKETEFNKFVEEAKADTKNMITNGVFAPVMTYKTEWVGHDQLFYPQSQEDSDMWYRAKQKGYKFIQSWDSFVYHFTSRGSRFNNETKNTLKDSEEWKKTNTKNLQNFVRRYGNTPLYTPDKAPVLIDYIPISAHILACDRDATYVYQFLTDNEPYFDEMVFVIDAKNGPSKIEQEIERYCRNTETVIPTNFDRSKFKIHYRLLNNDFAAQTNFAVEKCTNDWTIKIDLDETFSDVFLNNLKGIILDSERTGKKVVGFPRINILNNVIVNDVPRSDWTEEKLKKHPQIISGIKNMSLQNSDTQFRLHKRDIKWIGKVHEVPEPVAMQDKNGVAVVNVPFQHIKTVSRQTEQNKMYADINNKKEIKKLIYDSVIFTTEGITKHAREEVKEFVNRGYHIQLQDSYRFNPQIEDCEFYKKLYEPVDVINDDYAVICNQPPERWPKSLGLKNFIGFVAFEGLIPEDWTRTMNAAQVREVWTPSEYCKKCFEKSGVQKPIHVIPHGINPEVWKYLNLPPKTDEPFTFLWMGTSHNSRKGMDLMIKAFSQTFTPEDNVRLILKVNRIYDKNKDTNKIVHKNVSASGNKNIYFVEDDMKEIEMVELMNKVNVFVSPHRSEGFGLNILQALACGTPVIATKATGNMDFCNDQNTHFIEIERDDQWAPFIYPYINTQWFEPKLSSLKDNLKFLYENYDVCKTRAIKESKKIRDEWTWKRTVNLMERRLKDIQ